MCIGLNKLNTISELSVAPLNLAKADPGPAIHYEQVKHKPLLHSVKPPTPPVAVTLLFPTKLHLLCPQQDYLNFIHIF